MRPCSFNFWSVACDPCLEISNISSNGLVVIKTKNDDADDSYHPSL